MAKKNGNILIVDDNRGVLTALQLLLKPYFEGIITLPSPVTLTSVLRERSWQVVLRHELHLGHQYRQRGTILAP